ncbi:hypothetical protein [Amycolatopsis taiwanensis]|uniref:hypothetical protein n=1 Tax=Amycolatopsis taiwanensis TaxID=342230 RepID=UPI0004865A12|nr:hypothetical protein [Amycolatopsis taiwanensis]
MSDNLTVKVAAYKLLADHIKGLYDLARAEIAARMERGDRLTAVTADGVKIGAVSKKDPKPLALVVDAAALREWIAEYYPERLIEDLVFVEGADEEIKEVLLVHAPHLVRQVRKADPDIVRAILTESSKRGFVVGPGGEAEVPGVEVQAREGVVACLPTDDAMPAVVQMLDRGEIDLFDVLPGGDS